jgi:hypothetical protein
MHIPRQDLQAVVLLSYLAILGFFQPISARQNACYNVSAVTVSDISARVLGKSALLWDHDVHCNVVTDWKILGMKLSLWWSWQLVCYGMWRSVVWMTGEVSFLRLPLARPQSWFWFSSTKLEELSLSRLTYIYALKMEATLAAETLVPIFQGTLCYSLEETKLRT